MSNSEKRSVLCGFENAIFDLVDSGATAKQWGEWLRVPLEHAVAVSDLHLVIKLARAGAKGNPLCIALMSGRVTLARDLVKQGASVISTDEYGNSPLALAATTKDEETMSLLLQKGACPDTETGEGRSRCSLLYLAASYGRLPTVNVLLDAGADVNLRYCKENGSTLGVAGADARYCPNDRQAPEDNSALDVAAANGDVGIVTALIRSEVNVNAVDWKKSTPLHKAACCTSSTAAGVIDVLVKAGADVNAVNKSMVRVPLHYASDAGTPEAILALLKNGARVDEKDTHERSPLRYATLKGNVPAMQALLTAGADVNAIDCTGTTALHDATRKGNLHATGALLAAGADVNAIDRTRSTALHNATICGNRNAWGRRGNVPSYSSTRERSDKDAENAVYLLLRWGADETAVNAKGRTPLEGAVARFGSNNVERLQDLLTQAPLDRIWYRRSWLLLYRAYPRRMVPIPSTGEASSDRVTRKRCRARSVSTETAGGAICVREGDVEAVEGGEGAIAPGGWNGVVTWVVGTELEGVFRNIVGYL